MDQTAIIAAALIIAFIVFITVRGELGQYIALFKGNGNSTSTTANPLSTQQYNYLGALAG